MASLGGGGIVQVMFIRQTKTNNSTTGDDYHTFRLVASVRIGDKVRQKTVLNLGRSFSLPKEKWSELSSRIEEILGKQPGLFTVSKSIEALAQRYAAILIAKREAEPEEAYQPTHPVQDSSAVVPGNIQPLPVTPPDFQRVDINSLEMAQPRTVGVEHVGLDALNLLDFSAILEDAGLNRTQRVSAIGSVIARMAEPGSERASWQWLRESSALGELLGVDLESMSSMRLYRVSDLLIKNRDKIENAIFSRVKTLFSLPVTVTLYDLTNTYFEGEMVGNSQAARGHSKEKRSDCPIVTLGLMLDSSGFVRHSQMFAGNVSEPTTLESMLGRLDAPAGALVIMDRGIATEANVAWLTANKYRYLVVSRERQRQFDLELSIPVSTASGQIVHARKVLSEDGKEARLYCYSEARQEKENAMTTRFCTAFEQGLQKLADGLTKPRCQKHKDKLNQRIGRLQAKSHGVSQHYRIELTTAKGSDQVNAISWERIPVAGSMMTNPGVYCLRTNELTWDETTLWQTYIMLTDLESVFRSLKSELGLRPVFHQKEERANGHLFITVLAYQAVQVIRNRLKGKGIHMSWNSVRKILTRQQRVTASFTQDDGRSLHVRKSTLASPQLQEIYNALGISASPGGIKKMIVN